MRPSKPSLERLEGREVAFALASPWPSPEITFSFVGSPDPSKREVVLSSLSRWAAVSPLRLREAPDAGPVVRPLQPDLDRHDGTGLPQIRIDVNASLPSRTLGLTYFPGNPGFSGDTFISSRITGALLDRVATHEIGHALGLKHSDVIDSVMAETAAGDFTGLHPDDVAGIQALYGDGVGSVLALPQPPISNPPASPERPSEPFPGFAGEVLSVSADVDRDGTADALFVAQGEQGHLVIVSGSDRSLLFSTLAFPGFRGNVSLAGGGAVTVLIAVSGESVHVKVYEGVAEVISRVSTQEGQG